MTMLELHDDGTVGLGPWGRLRRPKIGEYRLLGEEWERLSREWEDLDRDWKRHPLTVLWLAEVVAVLGDPPERPDPETADMWMLNSSVYQMLTRHWLHVPLARGPQLVTPATTAPPATPTGAFPFPALPD